MMNILLTDDEFLVVEQLEYLIMKSFPTATIFKAYDASQALQIAKAEHIHLSFLDIQMPSKNGLQLAKELKELYNLEIIMVTAYQNFEFAQEAIRIGVNDYITKPIIETDFKEALSKYVDWGNSNEAVRNTFTIINERYQEKLTVNSIAKEIFVHPSYLSRKFFEAKGIGLNEYINHFRLEKASAMLHSHLDLSISSIAEKCGFSSQHYFSVAFKKKFLMTPREYRTRRKDAIAIEK